MQKNRLSLVGGGMGGGYTTTGYLHYYQHYYYIEQFSQYNAIVKFYEFPIYYYYIVIYSTTNDKPVLGEIAKMGLCQILKRCILCIEGDRKTPPVACQWNTRLKPTLQTPIFSVPTPPLDIFSVQVYNYFSTLFILALQGVMI